MSLLAPKKQVQPTVSFVLPSREELDHMKNLAIGAVATVVVVKVAFMVADKVHDMKQNGTIKKLKARVEELESRVAELEKK